MVNTPFQICTQRNMPFINYTKQKARLCRLNKVFNAWGRQNLKEGEKDRECKWKEKEYRNLTV